MGYSLNVNIFSEIPLSGCTIGIDDSRYQSFCSFLLAKRHAE